MDGSFVSIEKSIRQTLYQLPLDTKVGRRMSPASVVRSHTIDNPARAYSGGALEPGDSRARLHHDDRV